FILIILIFGVTVLTSAAESLPELEYQVLASYNHDPKAFTQGLEIHKNYLYEGTGLYNRSSLRKVDIQSGSVLNKIKLDSKYFGEGITILNNRIYQLTWKEKTAFVYDLNFNLINKFNYQGEGWGLSNDGEFLIMSDGSEYLYYRNPETFELVKKITVKNKDQRLKNINELEYQGGYIYANIWQTDYIIKINAQSGAVKAYLDLSGILKTDYQGEIDVLNGIAYDPEAENFLITGKLWPKIYRIKIID
ncbi:MAG: glutamine cyclotransferase, partial [Halanaerobium sp.]